MKFWSSLLLLIIFLSSCTHITIPTGNIIKEPSSEIQVYFCPQEQCMEKIITLIDSSTDIKCAFYDLNLPELIEKLKQKNADVVIEDSNELADFHSGYSYALMHNKFCVFDSQIVLTGSMNPTERGNYYNNNNIVIVKSKTLAQNYLDEFNELKNDIYGEGKKVTNSIVYLGNTKVENYFCPEDICKLRVINALKEANKSIYYMTFSFTDEDIGNLLWNKNYLGLDVKGILEEQQIGQYSRYEDLKEFSELDSNKYKFHHKVFIIDNKTVITGSYNPTKNGNERNDENIIIIHDSKVTSKFIEEFNRNIKQSAKLPEKTTELIINKVLYDAKGNDKGNEFVELKNIGNKKIILDYYFLSNNNTNSRLNGTIFPNKTLIIKPKFTLKNSNGILVLKKNHEIIDVVYWEGEWDLEAKEGKTLVRNNINLINAFSWTV